jgi:hypothetical protein
MRFYQHDEIKEGARGEACGTHGTEINTYQSTILVGKPRLKIPIGSRHSLEDSVKMDLEETGLRRVNQLTIQTLRSVTFRRF